MAAILQDWISSRLHKNIRWSPDEFGDIMRDGSIISQLLHSYGVINDDQLFITRKTTDLEPVKKNWKYISVWLKEIDIDIDEFLPSVLEGDRSVLLKIFYQLFLNLDKKDRLTFIKKEQERTSNLIEKMNDRFHVMPLEEPLPTKHEPLAQPLVTQQNLKDWYKEKVKEVEHTYSYLRSRISRFKANQADAPQYRFPKAPQKIENKDLKEMNKFEKTHGVLNYTFKELQEMQKKNKYEVNDADRQTWAQNFLESLDDKLKNRKEETNLHKAVSNDIRTTVWNELMNNVESKADYELAKCVLKLSQFEKQMCTQLMEIKQQTRNLIANRLTADREFANERDQQFLQYMNNLKRQIMLQEDEISIEKARQKELHKRLIAKKVQALHDANYRFCYETLESMIDFALRYSYTALLFGEVPECCIQNWKNLFFKEQPIFEILEHVESILVPEPEPEEIVHLEVERQYCLNASDFSDYHNFLGEWQFEHFSSEEELNRITLGSVIVAHVIYTLLNMKYPIPATKQAFGLPAYTSKAILIGLKDLSLTVPIQALLKKSHIAVVRLETALNFCLQEFKKESSQFEKICLRYDKLSNISLTTKSLLELMQLERGKSDSVASLQSDILEANQKQTQTPSVLPGDITFTRLGELGRNIHETLSVGHSLPATLICRVIAEYIKSLPDISGFVLINYPNNFSQAQELEEVFTGCRPQCELLRLEGEEIMDEYNKDPNKKLRISRLYDDPHGIKCEECDTYFTCYMKLKECENIYDEDFIWNLTEENSDLIERFYADKGINYSLYHTEINKDMLALVCRYIIGDFETPFKDYSALFGKVYSTLDIVSTEGKHNIPKVIKGESKKKLIRQKSTLSEKSKSASRSLGSLSSKPESVQEINGEQSETNSIRVNPGEKGWIYASVHVPDSYLSCLGSLWEEAEKAYIENMNQLFFSRRLLINNLIPYVRFIKDKIVEVIARSDNKQSLINAFVEEFNEFNNDWRVHVQSKIEWHCRVVELQKQMQNICDLRKRAAEEERYSLICDHWSLNESNALANIYISCMQSELNRSVLTYQMLQDFYLTILKPYPNLDTLASKELQWISNEMETATNELIPTSSKKNLPEKDKGTSKLKQTFIEMHNKNIPFNESNNPYYSILENNVKTAIKHAQDFCDTFSIFIHKEATELTKGTPVTLKRRDDSLILNDEEAERIRENCAKCLDEWSTAIEGELSRLAIRLQMLLQKAVKDLKLLNDNISKAFIIQQDFINETYLREMKAVENVCHYLQLKVEEEKPIPGPIKNNQTSFSVEEAVVKEKVTKKTQLVGTQLYFKVGQLKYLVEQLKLVAPRGFLLAATLNYVFQDFLLYGREKSILPQAWYYIEPEKVQKLIHQVYGGSDFIDWRSFLIFTLNLRMPDLDELLQAKRSFMSVDDKGTGKVKIEQFKRVKLWNELDVFSEQDDKCGRLKKYILRAFLFETMKNEEEQMDYLQFLNFFCQNYDPCYGFGKSICVALGTTVCFEKIWIPYAYQLIKKRKLKDIEHMEATNWSFRFVDELITRVIKYCEGVTVTDVPPRSKSAKSCVSVNMHPTNLRAVESENIPVLPPHDSIECLSGAELDEFVKDKTFTVPAQLITSVIVLACPWVECFKDAQANFQNPVDVLENICEVMSYDTDHQELYICLFLDEPFVKDFFNGTINKYTLFPFYEWVEEYSQCSS